MNIPKKLSPDIDASTVNTPDYHSIHNIAINELIDCVQELSERLDSLDDWSLRHLHNSEKNPRGFINHTEARNDSSIREVKRWSVDEIRKKWSEYQNKYSDINSIYFLDWLEGEQS